MDATVTDTAAATFAMLTTMLTDHGFVFTEAVLVVLSVLELLCHVLRWVWLPFPVLVPVLHLLTAAAKAVLGH